MNEPTLIFDTSFHTLSLSDAGMLSLTGDGMMLIMAEYNTIFDIQPGQFYLLDEMDNILTDEDGNRLTW